MVKKLQLIVVLVLCLSFGLFAQVVVVNEQFESGAGNWDGWIDTGSATVTASVDATGKLSGTNSYLLDITNGSADTYRIQRNTNCPLLAGQQYTVSFLAVADKPTASINVLFEIDADPWTKRLNETALVDTVAKLFTYVASISQNVANNELKLHFGGTGNNNTKIWVDSVVVTYIPDPTLVTKWGATSAGNHYPILNDSSTADGAAAMGSGAPPTAWSTISGQFNQLLEATTDEAVVVSGKFEYVGGGGGDTYTPLRYALTYVDSIELKYQYTDSAMWVATADSAKNKNKHSGYGFHPRTGSGVMSNGAGGSGTVWTINRGTWTSTWSNNGGPIAAVNQTPRNSKLVAGVYDWAISVKKISDTENEIRWYFVETTSKYSFAGSAIDTAANTKFNSVSFGVNTGDYTQVNLMQVKAELGDPITVPGPIWEAYFLDMWGLTGAGKAWPILNDTSTYVGDGYIGGENPIPGWATIRGGFGQDVSIPSDKAIVVTGEMEFVGGGCGDTYTPLRYALTYVDSMELKYQLTDSAAWVSTADSAKNSDRHYGWGYHPRTGAGTMSNGNGGSGTVWTINRGTWNSTWGNNGLPIAAVKQAPRNAEIIEGVYEWAISVQKISDLEVEIRWYMVEKENRYWYGGTVVDSARIDKLNGVSFGVNTGDFTQFKIIECEVDLGTPITVPTPPWEDYFISTGDWGIIGEKSGGTWEFVPGEVDGNAGIVGAAAATDWAAIRGGIEAIDIKDYLSQDKSLQIEGKIQLVGGGFETANSLRFGLFYGDSVGSVQYPDSSLAHWTGKEDNHYGYLFVPPTGSSASPDWNGVPGMWGGIVNDVWADYAHGYALGEKAQEPAAAVGSEGTYNFKMAVSPLTGGGADIRYILEKVGGGYSAVGYCVDNTDSVRTKFNGVCFALGTGNTTTALNVIDVQVTQVDDPFFIDGIDNKTQASGLPTAFALEQNYPNPFNPSTTLEFALPQNSDVNLEVYDILGKQVAKLAAGNYKAGYHKITFNGSNLATGIYFFKFKAGDFVAVKKAMLLK